jgi:alpha-L-fucosidase
MNGNGDVVKAVSDACRKYGLKFGIYLSPWDRNHKDYGTPAYVQQYRDQLIELFSSYGPIFEMWFDGANGGDGYYGGAREKRSIDGASYYEWPATLDIVRKVSPGIIFFSDAGPGVRWVGNEKGFADETNWSMLTPDSLYAGKAGIEALLNTGSENGTQWIPAEVDVSIRPGWFYHSREDTLVKSPEQLFDIYLTSVGRGSTLLLNIPPDQRGLLHEKDIASLQGFRQLLNQEFKNDLAKTANITSSTHRGSAETYAAKSTIDGDSKTFWATDDQVTSATIELNWTDEQALKYLVLQEYIQLGQRIRSFTIESWEGSQWRKAGAGTTVGYKRIIYLGNIRTNKVRITINDARACPVIHTLSVF